MDDRRTLEEQVKMLKELQRRKARRTFHDFLAYVNPKYQMMWYHKLIADYCQLLFEGVVPKLMITCPPQHGKSEIVSRLFPAWALGVEPDLKIVGCSYSATLAGSFNRAIQRVIGGDEYKTLFPDTFLNDERLAKYRGYQCNAEMFECVGHGGYYKSVGVGGSLTGTPADIAIIDDPVKDAMEANSPQQRDNVWDWYTTVLSTRLHNASKQMLVMTRWHEDDLAGRILNSPDGKNWKVINIPAVCTMEDDGEFHSGRKVGDALWPERHSIEKLNTEREKDPNGFNCLYQGDPASAEGRLYHEFKMWVDPKEWGEYVRSGCYVDVADKGTDDTTAICYDVYRSPSTIYNEQTKRMEPLLFALVKDVEINPANTDTTRVTVPAMINTRTLADEKEKPYLEKMRALIREELPDAEECISYNMPAYRRKKVLVYFAAGKNHLGFYPTPGPIEQFAEELKEYHTSKGAVQFPYAKPLPEELIRKMIRYRAEEEK